jgi:nucleotide-binding universal stress UspA family protein
VVTPSRILCPTDFSDISQHALRHAVVIAEWYDARIVALHADDPLMLADPIPPYTPFIGQAPPEVARRESLTARLHDWLAPATDAGLRTDLMVEEGDPVGCLLTVAKSLPADLIVIGTHGRSGWKRLTLGSVAEQVLRKATCPVMVVPPSAPSTPRSPFKQILCPVDFSDASIAALRFALSMAQEGDARLTVLHVSESRRDDDAARMHAITGVHRASEAETRRQLAALVPDDARNGCDVESDLEFGKADEQILSVSAARHADLIVMGVHGRSAMDVALFGSTTQAVVRQAACAVLTLRK